MKIAKFFYFNHLKKVTLEDLFCASVSGATIYWHLQSPVEV